VKRALSPAGMSTWMVGIKYPMAGVEGGRDGAPNQLTVRFDTRPKRIDNIANAEPHEAGEAFEYLYGGGGGYGDPLERDPAAVRDDVLDEYVSREAAERDYGVVLAGECYESELRVDEEKTRVLRAKMLGARDRERVNA
jgi:N-methylhydantoinase B